MSSSGETVTTSAELAHGESLLLKLMPLTQISLGFVDEGTICPPWRNEIER
jgi:hypothetical protein